MSWQDNRDDNREIYFARVSAAGVKIGADLRVTSNGSSSRYPFLSWTGSEYGVSWFDDRDGNDEIYFARVSAAGAKIGADLRVTSAYYNSWFPSLSWAGSEYGVSWYDNRDGNYEIYFARVSAAGAKIGADIRVTSNNSGSGYPSLSWTGSEYGVSWVDYRDGNYEIYFNRVIRMYTNKDADDLHEDAEFAAGTNPCDPDTDGDLSNDGTDCNPTDPTIFPGAVETLCDHIDQDCDGLADDGPNADGDPIPGCDGDCDDTDPNRYPGAVETTCDNFDQNCNGLADDDPNLDGDPVSLCAGDCNDTDPTRYPAAVEITCDAIDQDCDGLADDDINADGDPVSLCAGDCDDNDPALYPGATEITCDGVDQDCDGLEDDDPNADGDPANLCADCDDVDPNAWTACATCHDNDGDSYHEICDAYNGINGPDCDDSDPTIHPGAGEIHRDGIDQDCDGLQDDVPWPGKKGDGGGGGCGCMVAPSWPASASLPAAGLYALPLAFALCLRKAAGKRKRRVESRE